MRDWVTNVDRTHYLLGTVAGPHPFPVMVRDFQRVIGDEAQQQVLELTGRLPDAVVACVGGGSNAMGIFAAFLDDADVRLYGFEAGGDGIDTGRHAARMAGGSPASCTAPAPTCCRTRGPDRAVALDLGRARLPGRRAGARLAARHRPRDLRAVTDAEAMDAFALLCRTEGIIPAIESAHALAGALKVGRELGPDAIVLVNLSGRGDKDVDTAAKWFEVVTDEEIVESATAVVEQDPQDASGEGW